MYKRQIDGLSSSVTFVVMLGFLFVASFLGNTAVALFASSSTKELPMMRSASSFSPRPRWMEHRGEPPIPHRLAKPIMCG